MRRFTNASESVSRRTLFALAATAPIAAAQQTPAQTQPQTDDLKAALAQQRSQFDQMKKVNLSRPTEPAAVFRP